MFRYKVFLLVSGGIGISPMQSIATELLEQQRRGRKIHRIYFVWVLKNYDILKEDSTFALFDDAGVKAVRDPGKGYNKIRE